MKKTFTLLFFLLLFIQLNATRDSIYFQEELHRVDTLIYRHDAGLNSMHTYYSLPDIPLLVNVLEIELSNPYLKVVSALSHDSLRNLEAPSKTIERISKPGYNAFAAINGDFYSIGSGADQGMPVNGHMSNGHLAKVPHSSRPVIAFDHNKNPFIDIFSYSGALYYNSDAIAIDRVNDNRGSDELVLFNHYNGRTTRTNDYGIEVVAKPVNGEWSANNTIDLEVIDVFDSGSTLLSSDKIVLSGHGDAAQFLSQLSTGDNISVELSLSASSKDIFPELNQMIGGDRTILLNGEIQDNDWVQLHPRTAAGYCEDKERLFLMVVDGRSDQSNGVSTKMLAELLKLSGAANAINLDGGGSSAMVLHDKIVNTPSDGYERRVANSLVFVSEAPEGDAVDFKLNAKAVRVPFGNSFQLKGSTFNEYGDVVDYKSAKGVTYSIEGDAGDIDKDGIFRATGYGSSVVTASWEGVTREVQFETIPAADLSFSVEEITIDNRNEYQFEVYGFDINGDKYLMDNDLLEFESSDESIGKVSEDGVLQCFKTGSFEVRVFDEAELLEDFCNINVEVGKGFIVLDDFMDPSCWEVSSSWIDNVTLSVDEHPDYEIEMMKVEYDFTYYNRTASITLTNDILMFGMPDSLRLEATGNGYDASFMLTVDHSAGITSVPKFSTSNLQEFKTALRVNDISQTDYPLSFKSIRLIIERDSQYESDETYQGEFWLKNLSALYPTDGPPTAFVDNTVIGDSFSLFPNPAFDKIYIEGSFYEKIDFELFDLNGQSHLKKSFNIDSVGDKTLEVDISSLSAGVYLYYLNSGDDSGSGKVVISM
ncbi:phosphodiester glycosidase family protein [Marinilabiliaceae bacterium ANBcel2]|nr:phosphodiester glycosidase family protein [Marinilabiliaceae bacterium ANBcel2]